MSADGADDGGPGNREVAVRLFAAEYDDADLSYSESEEERAPNYVVTPTGARVNRLFVVGVLTEVEPVNEEMLRARVVDPTGPFVVYAGQYQPDALAFLERAEPPAFVAVTGKARTFEPEDGDRVYTSVRPESISEVDAATRDRWVVGTAERTLERIETMASALASDARGEALTAALREQGVDESLAAGIPRAIDHYGTTAAYLAAVRDLAVEALEVVADEREEVSRLSVDPDSPGSVTPADLTDVALPEPAAAGTDAAASTGSVTEEPPEEEGAAEPAEAAGPSTEATEAAPESEPEPETPSEASAAGTDAGASTGSLTEEPPEEGEAAEPAEAAGAAGESTAEATEPEAESAEPAESPTEPADEEELGDFDGEFDLDEEERQEVEEEFGTEFESGAEVDEPGSAGIEPEAPQPEPDEEAAAEEPASGAATEPESGAAEAEQGTGEEVDLEDAVMETMRELNQGDGADRDELIAAVAEEYGVDPEAVDDAIQEALMSGQCYEPDDGVLKPI